MSNEAGSGRRRLLDVVRDKMPAQHPPGHAEQACLPWIRQFFADH